MGAPPPAPLPPKTKGAWYGWQILTAVGASDTLFIAGAATGGGAGSSALIGTGIVGHLLSGAAVHFAHRNWKMGGASIGLNVGGPLVLGPGGKKILIPGGPPELLPA